jgi:hypothetical protein
MTNSDLIKEIVDKVEREEFGGAMPSKNKNITLKAIVSDGQEGYGYRIIYVFLVGKWRQQCRTGWKGLPTATRAREAIERIKCNCPNLKDHNITLEFIKFNVPSEQLRSC